MAQRSLRDHMFANRPGEQIVELSAGVLERRRRCRIDRRWVEPPIRLKGDFGRRPQIDLREGRCWLRENVFEKIGMDGSLLFEKDTSIVKNRAYGYSPVGVAFRKPIKT